MSTAKFMGIIRLLIVLEVDISVSNIEYAVYIWS